jgi:c-di-GMP-binding flagellar brake protein YcgR
METKQERRKFVRLNTLVDVVYNKVSPAQKVEVSLTKNISKGGICLIAYDELKVSDKLDLNIYLPEDKTPVHAIGRVAWVQDFVICNIPNGKRFDVGIEFTHINEQDLEKIDKHVFSHFETEK